MDHKEFERLIVNVMRENAFFTTVSRYVRKEPTDKIPTAGVGYDKNSDDITLWYNPAFFDGLNEDERKSVLWHEFYHLTFMHLAGRRKDPPRLWNIATDLAINSIIVKDNKGKLPDMCFLPGKPLKGLENGKVTVTVLKKDGTVEVKERDLTPEEKEVNEKFSKLIADMPDKQASDWYFEKLLQFKQENPNFGRGQRVKKQPGSGQPQPGGGEGEPNDDGDVEIESDFFSDSFDDHEGWGDVPEEMKDMVEGRLREILRKGVQEADKSSHGWGTIPQEVREEIRRSVSRAVDWKAVLRNFVGMLYRGERSTSVRKINRKFPYIHPGVKRGHVAKLLIAVDQSGSVGDEALEQVFSVLSQLSKKVTFVVCAFDTEMDTPWEWRKGMKPEPMRVRSGGTDFEAPTRWVNDPKRRGEYDGMIIVTDGIAPKPSNSRVKRGWILTPGCKIDWATDEMVVNIEPEKK